MGVDWLQQYKLPEGSREEGHAVGVAGRQWASLRWHELGSASKEPHPGGPARHAQQVAVAELHLHDEANNLAPNRQPPPPSPSPSPSHVPSPRPHHRLPATPDALSCCIAASLSPPRPLAPPNSPPWTRPRRRGARRAPRLRDPPPPPTSRLAPHTRRARTSRAGRPSRRPCLHTTTAATMARQTPRSARRQPARCCAR